MKEEINRMGEQESMEAGLLKKPLLDGAKVNQNDDSECRITAVLIFSTLITVFGSFCFGLAVGYSSAAQSGMMKDLGLSVAEYSMFGSLMTFGGTLGALFSGKIADLIGRKRTMWFCEAFCVVGWLAIAFAQGPLWLYVGRLSLGIGIGLFSYVIPVYIAEISPKHIRGAFVFGNQLMQNCGISLFFIIGNFMGWRMLAIIGFVSCALHAVGLFFIPESPRWLGKYGEEKKFRAALQRLRGQDSDISLEANAIKENIEWNEQCSKSAIKDLFQKRYARSLIIGVGLMLLQQLSGSTGITYYASSIIEKAGFPTSVGTTVLAIILIPKAIIGLILVEKMGRRPLLMASSIGVCFFFLLLSASFCLQAFNLLKELTPIFTFIGLLGSITTFAMGMGALPWIIMSEIFPINVKVSAGSLVTLTNWSTSWIITYAFNFLMHWNASGTFFIFSSVCAATFVFVRALVPETKGRTLEEIQESLSNFLQ